MKKIYLAIIFCCCCFGGFASTWYSQNAGDASNLANWNSAIDGSGSTPVTFDSTGDLWIMQNSMSCSIASFFIAGSLTVDSAYFTGPDTILSISGNLSLTGNAVIDAQSPYDGITTLAIGGNLSITGSSYLYNDPAYTTIVFNNTSSTVASPQTITWTSTLPGAYVEMNINAGCVVQLLSNVTLPPAATAPDSINGTLICGNYVLNCSANGAGFQLSAGGTLYTANSGGVDSTVINMLYPLYYSSAANYVFNGTAGQVTGLLTPSAFLAGGSVTSSNSAGVMLSQSTEFGGGSTLALSGGRVILGTNNLLLDASSTVTGIFSSANMIVTNGSGQVQKLFVADTAFMYPVGDTAGNYSPIILHVTGSAYSEGGGSAAVTVTNMKHPDNANETNYINRYWSVALSGISSPSYTVGATYVPGDVTGTEAGISMGQYTSSLPWIIFGPTNVVTHTLSTTAVTDTASDFTGISTAGPSISSSASTAICAGHFAVITVTAARDTPLTYVWTPAAGLSVTTGTSAVATPDTTTTYTITVTDANGFTNTANTTITVNPLPGIHIVTGGGSYCAGGSGVHVGLNGSDTGVHYHLYYRDTVSVGSAVAGTGSAIDFGSDTAAGTYTVVAINATSGCSSNMTGSATIVINPVVVPSVSISASNTDTICAGETIYFTATPMHGGDEPSYQWMVNDTAMGPNSSSFSYVPTNGNIVSVKLTSDTVCAIPDTAIDSLTMVVHPHVFPTVTLSAAPGDTVCEGTSVVITATPGYGGNEPSFTWIKNTVIVSTDTTYAFIPTNGDNVYCIMQSNYFCLSATTAYSNVIDMTVENPVVPSVYITASPGLFVGRAKPDTFTAVVTNGGLNPSYQWYVNGAAFTGADSATFRELTVPTKDSISCIVTRNDACHLSNFTSVIVRVSNVGVVQTATTGADIKLAPNPNNGTFTVSGSLGYVIGSEQVDAEIADMLGQVVYRGKVAAQDGEVNAQIQTNSLANGAYILTLRSEGGTNVIRFVVAQ